MRKTYHNLVTSMNAFALGVLLNTAIREGDVKYYVLCALLVAGIVFNTLAEMEGDKGKY